MAETRVQHGMNKKTAASGGVSFTSMLAILFIGLKLAGVISWPWWAVLAPIWVPWAVVAVAVAAILALGLVLPE